MAAYCQARDNIGYMQLNCKLTCGFCPPPIMNTSKVKPDNQKEEQYCLNDEMHRTIKQDSDYDDYSDSDYEDEKMSECASVDDYTISVKNGKYSMYDSNGIWQVIYYLN